MKKLLICLLTILSCATLTACGGEKISADEAKKTLQGAITKTNEASVTSKSKLCFNISAKGSSTINGNTTKIKEKAEMDTELLCEIGDNGSHTKSTLSITGDLGEFSNSPLKNITTEAYQVENANDSATYDCYTYMPNFLTGIASWSYYSTPKSMVSLSDNDFVDFSELIADWDMFKKSGNTYTADGSKLSNFLLDELVAEGGIDVKNEDLNVKVKNFVIELNDDGTLNEIDIDILVSGNMSASTYKNNKNAEGSVKFKMAIELSATYDNYGSTTVSVPDSVKEAITD